MNYSVKTGKQTLSNFDPGPCTPTRALFIALLIAGKRTTNLFAHKFAHQLTYPPQHPLVGTFGT